MVFLFLAMSLNFRLFKSFKLRLRAESEVCAEWGWRDRGQSLIVASGKVHINYLLSIIIWVQVNTIGHDWHKLSFQWKILYLFGNSGLGYFNISVYLGKMQLLILEMQDNLQKTSFTKQNDVENCLRVLRSQLRDLEMWLRG